MGEGFVTVFLKEEDRGDMGEVEVGVRVVSRIESAVDVINRK